VIASVRNARHIARPVKILQQHANPLVITIDELNAANSSANKYEKPASRQE
jgi:hypothetical protein